jgi:hypothetical protein
MKGRGFNPCFQPPESLSLVVCLGYANPDAKADNPGVQDWYIPNSSEYSYVGKGCTAVLHTGLIR